MPPDVSASIEEDWISIFSISTTEYWDENKVDLAYQEKIGEIKINIRRYDFARIILSEYSHFDDGNQSSTRDIEVTSFEGIVKMKQGDVEITQKLSGKWIGKCKSEFGD